MTPGGGVGVCSRSGSPVCDYSRSGPHGQGLAQVSGARYAWCMLRAAGMGVVRAACLTIVAVVAVAPASASSRVLDGNELVRIGDLHETQNHLQEAAPYYQRAAAAFHKQKNRSGEAAALVRLGGVLHRQEKDQEAVVVLRKAVVLLGRGSELGAQGRALLALGPVAESLGRTGEARKAYERAAKQFARARDRKGRTESLIRLGTLLVSQEDVEAGFAYLQRALDDAKDRQDLGQQVLALMVMGDAHARAEVTDLARSRYEQGLRLADDQGEMRSRAALRMRLGRLYGDTGGAADGLPLVRTALGLYQALRDRSGEADALSLLGNLLLADGNTAEAALAHDQALELY